MTGQGHTGQIVLSYLTAVVFGSWSFDGGPSGGTLTSQAVIRVDPYRVKQKPLSVSIRVGKATWRRPVVELALSADGKSFTASLGPVESAA